MALPNPGMDAVPFTPLTAEFLDDMIENIESLSSGTGFATGAITTNTLAESAVTAQKIDFTTYPKFSVYRNSSQTLTTNVNTKIQFNTKLWDIGSNFDNTTNYRFVAPKAGYYRFGWEVDIASTSGTTIITILYKNGNEYKRGSRLITYATGSVGSVGSALVELSQGDYVELYGYGAAGTVITGSLATTIWLDGELVGLI